MTPATARAGMKRSGLRGRLPELYRCELLEDPLEALRERCEAAIHCPGRLGLLPELIMVRWVGAAKPGRSGGGHSQPRPRPLAGPSARELLLWGRLLLASLGWSKRVCPATLTACCKEVANMSPSTQIPLAVLYQPPLITCSSGQGLATSWSP